MTKKHFEAIAAIFASRPYTPHMDEVKVIIFDLADYFEGENPRFDRTAFLAACGLTFND